jgi:hypothetical protein
MSSNQLSPREVFTLLLERLNDLHAGELSRQITDVVSRGTVTPSDKETVDKKSQLARRMSSEEALAVALDLLISASQVPLMLNDAEKSLQCRDIVWMLDGPPSVEGTREPRLREQDMTLFSESSAAIENERENTETPKLEEKEQQFTKANSLLGDIDLNELKALIIKVVNLKRELNIQSPEVV